MSFLLETYRRNAAQAQRDAEQTDLPNVRERAIRAAETWTGLAERLAQVETYRRPYT